MRVRFRAGGRPPARISAETAKGCLTGAALGDVRRLCLAPTPDPFGRLRPPPDGTALRLSLELAYATYTLELGPWLRAGWTDVSVQVDNRLESGVTVGESAGAATERYRSLLNAWKLARARMALKERNPVAQAMGALRQREKSDTIKAVTMLHPTDGGRYVVAIGFMGTGTRFYDWFSNFRLTSQNGFHKGFSQLTAYFEQSAERILFPDTAAALGLPSLTLRDVLAEMRRADSRFSLWMAGHSQGAAVMQVFCHRLLDVWGVLPRHVVGYGFASPTTAAGDTGRPFAAYPLYHVLNTDDLVPRVGALAHLGMALEYRADAPMRDAAYGWSAEPAEAELRRCADALLTTVRDTPTLLTAIAAFLETVVREKTEESLTALTEKRWSIAPLDRAFIFAEGKAKDTLARMARYARVAYRSLTGSRMDEDAVAALGASMRPVVAEVPLGKLLRALRDRLYPPHMLCRDGRETGAYGYVVRRGSARLRPFVWEGAPAAPRRVYAEGFAALASRPFGAAGTTRRRNPPNRLPARPSPLAISLSARRGHRSRTRRVRAAAPR
jgi:hypothetical protein